ncbi:MAG TPA: ATP-dependent helicase, partial [Acidimicrobiales bacterium]|nr:ATP-dependent helicase [Acidimicrobiales bacterium]
MDRADRLLEGLTEEQRHAVMVEAAPLCILAGAGSGKTRVLTRRVAWRVAQASADPAHLLVLTFTRKAAGELRRRLGTLGVRDQVAAGTFHAVAWAQLRRRWADRGAAPPALVDRKARLLARVGDARPRSTTASGDARLAEVAGEIEWAKARLVLPGDYAAAAADAGRRPGVDPAEVADLYRAYEAERTRRGLVDFQDLLTECARAMEEDPVFAAAQRWRFRHVFVDEFQDVNPAQERLLTAWLGDRRDLCVVGDPDQAIYAWNGADPSALTDLPHRLPGTTVVRLQDNWRSSPQILAVAGAVLRHGRRAGALAALPRSHRPEGPVPTVVAYQTDRDEARGIARRLRLARTPGASWSQMAVLVRTNVQLSLLEEALEAAQIPHRVAGGGGLLTQPGVQDALAAIARARPGSLATALQELAGASGTGEDEDDDRRGGLLSLVRLAGEYEALDPQATAAGFRSWLVATLGRDPEHPRGQEVTLATFHRAKGLEWPVVAVAGLEQGLVPIGRAGTPAADAEERRLLYVALTRAEEELHCSWAARRTVGARTLRRSPSPYLEAIEAARASMVAAEPGTGVADLLAASRRALEEGSDPVGQHGPAPGRDHRPRPGEAPSTILARGADPGVL